MKRNNLFAILLIAFAFSGVSFEKVYSAVQDGPSVKIQRLDFEKADIRQIMKTLSEIGNCNIIVDRKITEDCTIYLSNVSWKEAFIAVLKMNDLVAYEDAGFIKVIKREDFNAQVKALKESERLTKMEKSASVRVIKIHNARAADVKATLDPLLSKNDQPSVDLRTNSLVFTVSDSSLAIINQIVKDLDTETRQVSIEVKMVTVDSGSTSELGVNWTVANSDKSKSVTQTTIGEEGALLLGKYTGAAGKTNIMANVATLINKNKAEVVSRPLVITQDNEAATISSGQEVPYITYDQARNTVVTLIKATTEMTVTPHVLSDDRILLDVAATRRSAEGVGVGLIINEESAQVKTITTNGETAVIGGMRQVQETKLESGIPILQDFPLVGQAFKYTKRETKKTDLIIFITPRIVENVKVQTTE
jgi:type IV pilus assembly protein PilQ